MKIDYLEMLNKTKINTQLEKKAYVEYARKSSEAEDRQVQSIEDQLKENNKLKISKGITSIETFKESKSAKMPGRTEFNRMIDFINQRNDIKGIICWKLNRLSRNPVDEGTLRWLLQSGKIDEIVTPEKTYTSVDSDFIMAIEGAQSQRFITDLRKDTARGIKSKLDKGVAPILAPPGYRNCTEKKQGERDIVPDPIQFPLVKKLFELFLSGNYSVQQLWYKAEELKVKSNRETIVSKTQLYKMLRNPFYTGSRFMYTGTLFTNGIHERMLTDKQFNLIQEILDKSAHPRASVHTDLLTGIMKCGECGRAITTESKTKHYKNGTSQTFTYYRCTKKWNDKKCSQPYIRAEVLEEQFLDYLDQLELSPKFTEWAIKWLKVMHGKQESIREAKYKATEQSYQEVVKRIERLVDLIIDGVLTKEQALSKKEVLESEKQSLMNELEKIDTHVSEWNTLAIQTFDFVKNVKERFSKGTNEQRKIILRIIGSDLTLKDKAIHVQVREPFKYIKTVVEELSGNKQLEPIDLPDITVQREFFSPTFYKMGD